MGGPYCETCKHGYFPVSDSIHGECSDPTKQIDTGGHSSSCPDITRRSECQNHTGLTTDAETALRDLRATTNNQLAAILLDNGRLRTALLAAVKLYGQPGGPWNVPSEPGTWLAMAKEALGVVEGTAGEAGEG